MVKVKFFAFDNNADTLIKKGLLVYDKANYYVGLTDEELDFFYDDNQRMVKVVGNEIYALVSKTTKDGISFEEYKYSFKEEKLEKELVRELGKVKIKEAIIEDDEKKDEEVKEEN